MSTTQTETPTGSLLPLRDLVSEYKELATVSCSLDKELKGTEKQPPASYPHYLPVWDEKVKYVGCPFLKSLTRRSLERLSAMRLELCETPHPYFDPTPSAFE